MGEFIPPRKLSDSELKSLVKCPECSQLTLKSSLNVVKSNSFRLVRCCVNCQGKVKRGEIE